MHIKDTGYHSHRCKCCSWCVYVSNPCEWFYCIKLWLKPVFFRLSVIGLLMTSDYEVAKDLRGPSSQHLFAHRPWQGVRCLRWCSCGLRTRICLNLIACELFGFMVAVLFLDCCYFIIFFITTITFYYVVVLFINLFSFLFTLVHLLITENQYLANPGVWRFWKHGTLLVMCA